MQRYLLFHGYVTYPCGGWLDFHSSYATQEEALAVARTLPRLVRGQPCWWHIVDRTQELILWPTDKG